MVSELFLCYNLGMKTSDERKQEAVDSALTLPKEERGGDGVVVGSDVSPIARDVKSQLNTTLVPRIDGVSEGYRAALNSFLRNFIANDDYSKSALRIANVKVPDNADTILGSVRDVYEATGIDLMKEAFYQYWKQHKELPEFYRSEKGKTTFDLSCIYPDDPRLHSGTDFALGDYVDDWRDKNVTDEQEFWGEVAESVKSGLPPVIEDALADQFTQRINGLGEKPDVITLMSGADPSKPFESYSMYPFGVKVSGKVGISFPEPFIRRTERTERAEKFQGSDKYFGRRSLIDGVLKVDTGKVRGKTILLLDDGWSSGASLDSVRKALYENGAKRVLSMCLVRC